MLVFLGAGLVGDGHALAGEFAAGEFADAGDDVDEGVVGVHGEEGGAVVAAAGSPGVDHVAEVVEQEFGDGGEVGGAAVGVGVDRVVLDGAGTGAVFVEVLAPEQEFDGVPAGGDVGFAALFVEVGEQLLGDLRVLVDHVDDAGAGVAGDVVDVGLVHGPGVELAFGAVLLVVDGSAVEAVGLGDAVVVAGGEPGALGGFEGVGGRVVEEGGDCAGHVGGGGEGSLVGGVDADGVVGDDVLLGDVGVVVAGAGGEGQRGCGGDREQGGDQSRHGEPSVRRDSGSSRCVPQMDTS